MPRTLIPLVFGGLMLLAGCVTAYRKTGAVVPYQVAAGLFNETAPDLGLRSAQGARTTTIWRAVQGADTYANGACIAVFRGRLYVQWQSSAQDEDSADTHVVFSVSEDGGVTWCAPRLLAEAAAGGEMRSSGGWWTDGIRLVAFINTWPSGFKSASGGRTLRMVSDDGDHWGPLTPVLDSTGLPLAGVIEQDIHAYDGRLHVAVHLGAGLVAKPHSTKDPLGLAGWTCGKMENLPSAKPGEGREIEPSLFRRRDGALVMVFRDQASSFRQLASLSTDGGRQWTTPVLTAMPDSRAKQSAGNLPDGSAFLVNCPRAGKERRPLAVTLASDGTLFTRSYLLRGDADLPAYIFPGKYKRAGYHYPKSLVHGGFLYVVYATNKEMIEVTRVPCSALDVKTGL